MKFLDFHCDTLYRMIHKESIEKNENLVHNSGHIDLARLNRSGYLGQCFACFINMKEEPLGESHYYDVHTMIDVLEQGCNKIGCYDISKNSVIDSLVECNKKSKTLCILTIEEGGILEGDISRLEEIHRRGVKVITLTWNHENCIGYPNIAYKYKDKGLKKFGVKVIKKMDELGIIVDVSHLSDAGFWDVAKYCKKPFIATHSNARAIMDHPRNLTDEMIEAIRHSGGIIGLNYYGAFLSEDGQCTFDILCKHIEHITRIGGDKILCLGSDFDGIDCELPMRGCEDLTLFVEAMRSYGFSQSQIEGYCYKNGVDFFERYELSN